MSDLDYIRNYYRVPAAIDGRILFTWCGARLGRIVGADGAYLMIRLDGEQEVGRYHPTWEIEYLPAEEVAA